MRTKNWQREIVGDETPAVVARCEMCGERSADVGQRGGFAYICPECRGDEEDTSDESEVDDDS